MAKTAFTKAKNQVLRSLEEECIEISDRNRVKEACEKLTIKHEQLILEIFEALIGEYSTKTDRQNRTKTMEEIEKMEHDFSEVITRAQQYLDNTFTDVCSHANSSRVKPASRIQPGEGYRQSDTKQAKKLQFSKEEIEIQTVLAEKELSRQIKALEEQVQQIWVRLKEQENATRLRSQQPVNPVNHEVKRNTMSKSIKQEVESWGKVPKTK